MPISGPDVSSLAFGHLIPSTFSQLFLYKEEYESDKSVYAEEQEVYWHLCNDSYISTELFCSNIL